MMISGVNIFCETQWLNTAIAIGKYLTETCIYIPANEIVGDILVSPCMAVCLCVCLSIRLSVESGFRMITPFAFDIQCLYFTHVFSAVCLSVYPSVCLYVEKGFPNDNCISFWHTMMILHTCIVHDRRKNLLILGSKVKVICVLWRLNRFNSITPLPFELQWWYVTHELTMTQEGPLLILGSIGKRSRSNSDFNLCTVSTR